MTTEDAYQWGLATGEMMERERIINLIEFGHGDIKGCCRECDRIVERETALIALIKGENK
jgi:hypothetical protein